MHITKKWEGINSTAILSRLEPSPISIQVRCSSPLKLLSGPLRPVPKNSLVLSKSTHMHYRSQILAEVLAKPISTRQPNVLPNFGLSCHIWQQVWRCQMSPHQLNHQGIPSSRQKPFLAPTPDLRSKNKKHKLPTPNPKNWFHAKSEEHMKDFIITFSDF